MDTNQKSRKLVVPVLCLLVGALGALALGPGLEGESVPGNCAARSVSGTYTTANAWQEKTVCNSDELAFAPGGRCPDGTSLRSVQLSAPPSGALDRKTHLLCSGTGAAEWTATCCHP